MKQKLSVQIEYRKIEGGIEIVKMNGRCAEVRIPEEVDGLPVIAVGEKAFSVKEELSAAEPHDELDAEIADLKAQGVQQTPLFAESVEWLDENGSEICNKILGHADPVQSGMELECEYVTHKINCGTPDGYKIAKSRGLDKNAARWNLLLQVDSNEDIGMMWGDIGRLYLWITTEDLAARNFENSWLILQCG